MLARAQARHRVGVAGVAREVKAAESLDRDDLAPLQTRERRGDRVAGVGRARRVAQFQPRAAHRARIGFGVEAAVDG